MKKSSGFTYLGLAVALATWYNRIVAERPGKLPRLVRADNIRSRHFSRNPPIVEFLKAYNFVKEYGEGVDCMCRELEAVGLQEPKYYTNAFLLQTVVHNERIGEVLGRYDNLPIGTEKSAVQNKRLAIESKKLAIDTLKEVLERHNYNKTAIKNIITIYNAIETTQIFGVPGSERNTKMSNLYFERFYEKVAEYRSCKKCNGEGKRQI